MKKQYRTTVTVISTFSLAIALFPCMADSSLSKGTIFASFFWTQGANDSVKNGCHGYTKINSVSTETGRYSSTFWLSNSSLWQKMFNNTYVTTVITTSNGKPAEITAASNHFSSVEWFTSFERTCSNDILQFYFPLLPQDAGYGRYDFFTVKVNDTTDLEFYGANDSIMVGTFVHKKPHPTGAVNILARNAFIVELTNANPLRIKSIRCNGSYRSLLTAYLKFNLDTLKRNGAWYGIDISDTVTNHPKIVVHSINIEGTSPFISDSTYRISWKLNTLAEVDSCIVEASFDNKRLWNDIGTTGPDSSFRWKIPRRESDSTYIKVTACGKHQERVSAISADRFCIKVDHSLSSESFNGNLNVSPSFTPITFHRDLRICYTLPVGVRELTVLFFDLKGRCIEQITNNAYIRAGKGSFHINRVPQAGYYMVQLHGILEDTDEPLIMSKRFIFMCN